MAVSFHRSYWDGLIVCMLDPRITAVTSRAWKTPRRRRVPGELRVIWTEEPVVARASRYVRDGGICWLAAYGFVPSGELPPAHSGAAEITERLAAALAAQDSLLTQQRQPLSATAPGPCPPRWSAWLVSP